MAFNSALKTADTDFELFEFLFEFLKIEVTAEKPKNDHTNKKSVILSILIKCNVSDYKMVFHCFIKTRYTIQQISKQTMTSGTANIIQLVKPKVSP